MGLIDVHGGSAPPVPRWQRRGPPTLFFNENDNEVLSAVQTLPSPVLQIPSFKPPTQTPKLEPTVGLRPLKGWETAPVSLTLDDSLEREELAIFSPRQAKGHSRPPVFESVSSVVFPRTISPTFQVDDAGPHSPGSPSSTYFHNRSSSTLVEEDGDSTAGPSSSLASYGEDSYDDYPAHGKDYLESLFDREGRPRSLSQDELAALPPFHVVAWLEDGRELSFPPEHPDTKEILYAHLYEDHHRLPEGIYVWHDELGRETAMTVSRKQIVQTVDANASLDTVMKQCPLPPHLDDLPYGSVVAQSMNGIGHDERMLSSDNVISTMLHFPRKWKVGDLPRGHVYRWRDIEDVTFVLNTVIDCCHHLLAILPCSSTVVYNIQGPAPSSSLAWEHENYAAVLQHVDELSAERTFVEADEIHQKLEEEDDEEWD